MPNLLFKADRQTPEISAIFDPLALGDSIAVDSRTALRHSVRPVIPAVTDEIANRAFSPFPSGYLPTIYPSPTL